MNWYLTSQQQLELPLNVPKETEEDRHYRAMEEFSNIKDEQQHAILQEFKKLKNKRQRQSWTPVPFMRVRKIWKDYAITRIVRDEAGMDEIARMTINNIAKMLANTELAGHTSYGWEEIDEIFELYNFTDKEKQQLWNGPFMSDEQGSDRISDYAMDPLVGDAIELLKARTSEEQLQIVDRVFNRVHRRGDLALNFIEGGSKSLNELYEG